MEKIGLIGPGSPGKAAANALQRNSNCSDEVGDFNTQCGTILPDQPFTDCAPGLPALETKDLSQLNPSEALQKLKEANKASRLMHNGPNRRQRHRAKKTKRAGMMRGNNFTPAKKKRR